jgi:glycerol kinase
MTYILAIDQGTTSSRAILFDTQMRPVQSCQQEFQQYFPQSGWVEHDAEEIWTSVQAVVWGVMEQVGCTAKDIAAIGITNQRETTLVWDRKTGAPIHRAIVWQDRRTSAFCDRLRAEGNEAEITQKTGLLLDPYFSATKLHWLLSHVDGAAERAARGDLLFGTMDSYLIWKLTEGRAHVTDATNAARTMLYDIRRGCWDAQICALMQVPQSMLPEVRDCASEFGTTHVFGADIPVLGVAGDQQAATIGQACFQPGMLKSTYGTGCFALLNTGDTLVHRKIGCLARSHINLTANRPTRWKARSLSPGRWCNGCATGWD